MLRRSNEPCSCAFYFCPAARGLLAEGDIMRSISNTIGRLAALRAHRSRQSPPAAAGGLTELRDFGSNPGALDAWYYVPKSASAGAPLVVVLHGCTQNAAGYNSGSGWSQLADEYGFALLFPEQRRANNMNLCFNWYEPGDGRRGEGEPLSIIQMVEAMMDRHAIDPARIYVNGLSAGGAMTSVMLATYPDVFAGGAIIAGLAFDTATSVPQAFDRMRGHGGPADKALAASVRAASQHSGPWPTISIWHGTSDHIVVPSNADAILAQWRALHGVAAEPDVVDKVDGYPRRAWLDAKGRTVIESYLITGMGHGTPLSSHGEAGYGQSGAHMLEVAISSTRHIAQFWGLTESARRADPAAMKEVVIPRRIEPAAANDYEPEPNPAPDGVKKVIEDALRAAGLMR
ncbi:MAG TPA: PHB depolymerase family esterase [Sphingomonas sp.]|jgi:poly(hydroxyalkanoate) depolymerase family esterase